MFHALAEAGLLLDAERLEHCPPSSAGGYAAAQAVLARRPRPSATLAFNDLVAPGAVQACQGAGRRVPVVRRTSRTARGTPATRRRSPARAGSTSS
ncbi:MAG: LacI family transcriptional regulator [Chloroflexales bacterium]|nr:LacI family transcriptional regulator [Chloroflexales bacterium]